MRLLGKVELDDIDIGILAFLSDSPQSTTTQVAKALYRPPYNITKLSAFIRYRMNRLQEEGVINKLKQSRKYHYSLDNQKVFFGDGVLRLDGIGEVQLGYFVVVKKESETVAKSLDDYEKRIGKKIFYQEAI
jgi:DNA-binding Lrp family transcriptional regulator